MLRDLISLDSQSKFIKQNLPELRIEYHSRGTCLQPKQQEAPLDQSGVDQQEEGSDNEVFDEFD